MNLLPLFHLLLGDLPLWLGAHPLVLPGALLMLLAALAARRLVLR